MKYCISYYKNFRHLAEVDEIIFPYSDNLPAYFEEKQFDNKQRILIHVGKRSLSEVMPILKKIESIHSNMAIIVDRHMMKPEGIQFFYSDYCKTFDQVYSFIQEGVSDVYVVESLGFILKDIGTYCHDHNVNVRVLPNVLQSSLGSTSRLPQVCQFFIRPQDTYAYEDFVDVFELFGDEEKLSVTYEIYKEQKWNDDFMFLIKGITQPMDLSSNFPLFVDYRLKCGQKCYNCNICTRLKDFNTQLTKAGLEVKHKEEQNEK